MPTPVALVTWAVTVDLTNTGAGHKIPADARHRPFNVAITNVPGPPMPLYFLRAPMRAIYPMMPLFPNQALSLAVLSYNGKVFWGFNSDWDALPDVHDLVDGIVAQFRELHQALESEGTIAASSSL